MKLFAPGQRVAAKSDTAPSHDLAAARVAHPVALDLMSRVKAAAGRAKTSEVIDFAPSDVATAYGLPIETAKEIVAGLERAGFLQARVNGTFGTHEGYVTGPAAR